VQIRIGYRLVYEFERRHRRMANRSVTPGQPQIRAGPVGTLVIWPTSWWLDA